MQQEIDQQRQEINQLRREKDDQMEQFMWQLAHWDEQLKLQNCEICEMNDQIN